MQCQRKACTQEYQSLRANDSGEDSDELTHCGEYNCHTIYWADRNGARCDQCFADACEACCADQTKGCMLDGLWYCADCRDRLVHEKQLVRCRNPHRACNGYAFPADFACVRCRMIVCNDCFSSVFGSASSLKTLCYACKRLTSKK